MTSALEVKGLAFSYGRTRVIADLSFTVQKSEIVTIIGPNGAGKSTLLNVIARSHRLRHGQILLNGRSTGGMAQSKVVSSGCVLVPEGRQVFSTLSVEDNLILGSYASRHDKNARTENCNEVYEIFPRLQERKDQLAGTLSGGEQQMLAIGRAIMSRPSVMLLDEPSLGLAPQVTGRIMSVLSKLRSDHGMTIVLVEQNANAALGLADRGYLMSGGAFALSGSSQELKQDPTVRRIYLGGGVPNSGAKPHGDHASSGSTESTGSEKSEEMS